jgi:hypothetical protein
MKIRRVEEINHKGVQTLHDAEASQADKDEADRERKRVGIDRNSQGTVLVDLFEALLRSGEAELFHSPGGKTFCSFTVKGHRETFGLNSRSFKYYLARLSYETTKKAPNSETIRSALEILWARALFDGPEIDVHVRVAEQGGRIYLDLGGPEWRAVEIDAKGWRIVAEPPVRFRRAGGMLPLPEPTQGGDPRELFYFVNLGNRAGQVLFQSWLVAAMRPCGPYPILAVYGGQGSGKSTLCAIARKLVDPSEAPLRTIPRNERDLMIATTNSQVFALDNVSWIPDWLSDALCRISTGGGLATRELYSNDEETIFNVQRPILLNGIGELESRSDLLDRIILLELDSIPKSQRQDEKSFWLKFDAARPRILGAPLGDERSTTKATRCETCLHAAHGGFRAMGRICRGSPWIRARRIYGGL